MTRPSVMARPEVSTGKPGPARARRRPAAGPRPVVGDRRGFARTAARVAVWQFAILAGLVIVVRMDWFAALFTDGFDAVPEGGWVDVVLLLACLSLFAITVSRSAGRWQDEAMLMRLRYRGRTRRARKSKASPVDSLVPGLTIRAHADRLGNRIGLLTDQESWTAIVRAEHDLSVAPDPHRLERMVDAVRATLDDAELKLAAAHLVTWVSPVATVSLDTDATADLTVRQVYWVGVRFDPALSPGAVEARNGGERGAMGATSVAALRLAGQLRAAGFVAKVLDGGEVIQEVHTSLGLDTLRPAAADASPPRATESWWAWSVGTLHQCTYRLRLAPRSVAAVAALLTRAATGPALFTCASVLFYRDDPGPVRAQIAVRVGVSAAENQRAVRAALRKAKLGARFDPLNGQHALGVRGTIPLGRRRP